MSPSARCPWRVGALLAALIMASAVVIFPLTAGPYWSRVVMHAFNFAVVALGWNVMFGYAGQFHFAPASIWGLGAYAAGLLAVRGWHPTIGLLAAALAGALSGVIFSLPALRLQGVYLALATLALGQLLRQAAISESALTGGPLGLSLVRADFRGVWASGLGFYFLNLGLLLATVACLLAFVGSRWGLFLRAIRDDEVAAEVRGVNTIAGKMVAFVIGSVFIAAAGGLFGFRDQFVSPDLLHLEYSFLFIVMGLFGGAGTIVGPIVGALSLQGLMEALRAWEHWRFVILGVLVVVTVLLFPRGVIGTIGELRERRRRAELEDRVRATSDSVGVDETQVSRLAPGGQTIPGER